MINTLPSIPCISDKNNLTLDELLEKYFLCGFTYLEIIEFLKIHHSICISLSTLKRHLKELRLFKRPLSGRRLNRDDVDDVMLVRCEIGGSGGNVGYRRIWAHLRKQGVVVRRKDVRLSILAADPEGVSLRRKKRLRRRKYFCPGPSHVWHIDGHDKLKPYGFSLHGCIEGFSRRLIWLDVSSSNKRPDFVASYYLNAVKQIGGIPKTLKADDGTEHSIIEPIHISLRELSGDQNIWNSFSIVTSPQNQRIEAYWSKLKGDRIGWWHSFFKDMLDLDMLDQTDPVIIDCIRFCFMPLIRQELKEIAEEWNQHIISKSLNAGPSGRPDTMFFLPHLFDCENYIQLVGHEEVNEYLPVVANLPLDYSEDFNEFANNVM